MAGYVDGTLPPETANRLESHLADCDACREVVGFLARERHATNLPPVPARTLQRARLRPPGDRPGAPRVLSYFATAAAMLLGVAVLVNLTQRPDGNTSAQVADTRTVRNSAPAGSPVRLLYPHAGTVVDRSSLTFRWSAVPHSHYYVVRIVTDTGDVVSEERVVATEWRPPAPLPLHPGSEYFVHVDAYPSDSKPVSSEHVPFRVAN